MVTKVDGSVKARYDYLPFGEELGAGVGSRTIGMGYSAADGTRQKFTAKERDIESGLDYFGARYYSGAQRRFTSTDPNPVTKENFVNPQRWNLYLYVNNNPLTAVDPNGGDGEGKGGDKVISVFLMFDKSHRYTDSRNGPGWQNLKSKNGYNIQVYGSENVAGKGALAPTPEAFEDTLRNSDVVIYVGHGAGDTIGGTFRQVAIWAGDEDRKNGTYYEANGSRDFIDGVNIMEMDQLGGGNDA